MSEDFGCSPLLFSPSFFILKNFGWWWCSGSNTLIILLAINIVSYEYCVPRGVLSLPLWGVWVSLGAPCIDLQ